MSWCGDDAGAGTPNATIMPTKASKQPGPLHEAEAVGREKTMRAPSTTKNGAR